MKTSWVLCVALALPARARAQSEAPDMAVPSMPARVELVVPGCTEALGAEVLLRMLRVELVGDGVERVELAAPGDTGGGALARVAVEVPRCAGDASEFLVAVDDAATRKSVRRAIELADVPPATRPRALALAVAELLRASWLELAVPTAPPTTVPVPETVRDVVRMRLTALAPRARPVREALRWTPFVALGFDTRSFPLAGTGVVGVRLLGGVVPPWSADGTRVRLRMDGGVTLGSGASLFGDVDVLVASGALGAVFTRGTMVALEFGPRIELGVVRAVGRAVSGRNTTGITVDAAEAMLVGVGVLAGVRGRLSANWSAFLECEGQWVFGGVDARAVDRTTGLDVRAAGVFGAMVVLRVGALWDP